MHLDTHLSIFFCGESVSQLTKKHFSAAFPEELECQGTSRDTLETKPNNFGKNYFFGFQTFFFAFSHFGIPPDSLDLRMRMVTRWGIRPRGGLDVGGWKFVTSSLH